MYKYIKLLVSIFYFCFQHFPRVHSTPSCISNFCLFIIFYLTYISRLLDPIILQIFAPLSKFEFFHSFSRKCKRLCFLFFLFFTLLSLPNIILLTSKNILYTFLLPLYLTFLVDLRHRFKFRSKIFPLKK